MSQGNGNVGAIGGATGNLITPLFSFVTRPEGATVPVSNHTQLPYSIPMAALATLSTSSLFAQVLPDLQVAMEFVPASCFAEAWSSLLAGDLSACRSAALDCHLARSVLIGKGWVLLGCTR